MLSAVAFGFELALACGDSFTFSVRGRRRADLNNGRRWAMPDRPPSLSLLARHLHSDLLR